MQEQGARQLTGRRRELQEILPSLRRFALSLTGDAATAEDLLHATVARVLKRGLPIEAELAPWCIRVCRQTWMDDTRAREIAAKENARIRERDSPRASSPESVHTVLADLPDDQRAVLELVAGEGHSYRAAAAMLDMPIGRVMSRLVRARGALIEHCRPEWQVPLERKAANHD